MHRYVSGAYGCIDLSPFRVPRDYSVSALNWFTLNFLHCFVSVTFKSDIFFLQCSWECWFSCLVLREHWLLSLRVGPQRWSMDFFRSGSLFSYVAQSTCRFTMWGVRNIDSRILLTVSHLRHPHLFPFRVTSYLRMWILWKALRFVGVPHEGGIMFFLTRAQSFCNSKMRRFWDKRLSDVLGICTLSFSSFDHWNDPLSVL